MSAEERLRTYLADSTATLPEVDHLEDIMAEGARRRVRSRLGGVLAAAAAVAIVFVAGQSLLPSTSGPVATQPDAEQDSTVPSTVPAAGLQGILVADANGVTAVDRDGNVVAQLASDPGYSEISTVFQDGRGGIVFQHAATPLPWPQGSLLHLEAGATVPSLLASPPGDGRIVPVGPAERSGRALFVYLADIGGGAARTEIIAVDLETGDTAGFGPLGGSVDMSVGGDLFSFVDRGGDCPTHSLRRIDGTEVDSPLPDCLPVAAGVALSGDGHLVAMLNMGRLDIFSLTGEQVSHASIPEAYMVTGADGGWVVRTPTETLVLDTAGGQAHLDAFDTGWVAGYSTLDLAGGATLGTASGERPCVPTDAPPAPQELPGPVAEKRAAIHAAAAACDYGALAALAETDGTKLTFGDTVDPVEFWVAEGTRGEEPLALMSRLLSTRPATDPDTGAWAWPAAHIDASDEESWQELAAVYDEDTLALLRTADAYLGFRLGIAPDGTWQYAVGGD